MKEESKKITLQTGNVSLTPELGMYYIDMRPAIIHYTDNIFNGCFDDDGVPMCGIEGHFEYSPINIAQYGFIVHADYLKNQDEVTFRQLKKCVEKLVELADIDDRMCIWWHRYRESKYGIEAPWASAMAQGEIISLFLRFYQLTNEGKYLELSKKAFNFLSVKVEDGGVRQYDHNGDLWLEEYPSNPPSFVLNGFLYALFGLYDLFRITNDELVWQEIELCIRTLKNNLHKFDAGYWSYYDLQKKELVRYYYQKNVHVPQMEVMYQLTHDKLFLNYKNKWEKTLNPVNFLFVRIMYRILPRWRKKSLKIK